MSSENPDSVVICRTCLGECKEYKSLHREGIIMGEITTLATLLHYCTGLELCEPESSVLPDFICTHCIQDLARSYIFKKKALDADEVLRTQLLEDDDIEIVEHKDIEHEPENFSEDCGGGGGRDDGIDQNKEQMRHCDSETDLKELAEAAQMKRELEAQLYEETTQEYTVIPNADHEQQIQEEEHHMEEDHDVEYVVQEVAEEVYHPTTDMEDDGHSSQEVNDIVDVEEETSVQQIAEDEEEVEFEIHVNDIEIVTDDPVGVENRPDRTKRHYDRKSVTNSDSDSGHAFAPKGIRNRSKSSNKAPNPHFQCKVCGKQLSNSSSFRYHMQLHSDKTPFKCEVCGECFKTRNAFDGHRSTHDPKNPNTCDLCGKSYRQPSSLRMHMLSHTGVKPFKCDICGKCLTQKSGYKKHMLTHTGEKPYSCDICGKSFRISSNMLVHRRSHLGDRPFDCRECDKTFGTAEQLKRHMLVHSADTPFSCDICGKQFKRHSTLRAHIQSHIAQESEVVTKEEK
uniref:Protein krueppel n=1 Tax=Stomoxys calcitrans TaxID=35570 RepID=A0A1I8P8Q5_STOCA